MNPGDVCRTINEFTGVLPDELSVYKEDIVQIHSVVDRHWVYCTSGGHVGKLPSSILVKIDLPPHPPDKPLFAVTADFAPAQSGDLGIKRGSFVVGLNQVDEAWWCGEVLGRTGIFPSNFVWKIDTQVIQEEQPGEVAVKMLGKVRASLQAQLPEELDLLEGEIVTVTHIVDNDWYRGESCGKVGIFPSNFIDIIAEGDAVDTTAAAMGQTSLQRLQSTDNYANTYTNNYTNYSETCAQNYLSDNSSHQTQVTPAYTQHDGYREPSSSISKIDTSWKTVTAKDDDIFEDDYFKQNMPGMYSSSSAKNSTLNSNTRYENYPSSTIESTSLSYPTIAQGADVTDSSSQPLSLLETDDYFKQNMPGVYGSSASSGTNFSGAITSGAAIAQTNAAIDRYQNVVVPGDAVTDDDKISAFSQSSDGNSLACRTNSFSRKVDDYLSERNNKNDINNGNVFFNNNDFESLDSLTSPGYNEDNTGIEPYGRAVFSFRAQYPNELTFKKGDIIHLVKHINSHWTLGTLGKSKGIFPTSYVDIIVDCIHSSEEKFLTRSMSVSAAAIYLGHAVAQYDFEGVQAGDVTMKKNDIMKIVKYVDNNWAIVQNTNGSKGMCPRNYLSMVIEPVAVSPGIEPLNLEKSPTTNTVVTECNQDIVTKRESRLSLSDSIHSRSRSASPYANRRSYNKDDFGNIKSDVEVEEVLAKNIASLEVSTGHNILERKGSGSVFDEREEVGKTEEDIFVDASTSPLLNTSPPSIPPRVLSRSCSSPPEHVQNSKKNLTIQPPLIPLRSPPIPPRLKRSNSTSPTSSPSESPIEAPTFTSQNEPIYSKVKKNPLESRNTFNRKALKGKSSSPISKESISRKTSISREDSMNFPEDVANLSHNSEASSPAGLSRQVSTTGLQPQRPAPPPPPVAAGEEDGDEEYYSLPYEEQIHATHLSKLDVAPPIQEQLQCEDDDDDNDSGNLEGASPPKQKSKVNLRRELVQEMVTTEHEYIHDLEALIQVIRLAPSQKESESVDIDTIMGNIKEVLAVSKKLLLEMQKVSFEEDEKLLIGKVFLECANDLCEIYKVYCSNHNIAVEALLTKYQQEEAPAAFLKWVLTELQQHKIQLMDMRSVLIKPVQRILKYPLFLDRLVAETPPTHPDAANLIHAKSRMASVAKDINEYTKRLDIISKYRVSRDQSFQSLVQRVNMHSVAKKSSRISALLWEKCGIMAQTKDLEFDEEEAKFRSIQQAATILVQDVDLLLKSIKSRHNAELGASEGLAAILLEHSRSAEMEAIRQTTIDTCNKLLRNFESIAVQRILVPLNELVKLCEVPERLIQKRHDKVLDYDNAQYKLDKNRDPTRVRILEEELSQVKGNYEALNNQLMDELPILSHHGIEMLTLCTRTLAAARMHLQGHLAKLYIRLAQLPNLCYSGDENMMAQFRVRYLQQVGEFRQLSFIPADYFPKSPVARPRTKGRKSIDNTTRKASLEGRQARTGVLNQYPTDRIYVVKEVHTPGEVMELSLYPGDLVAIIKTKDPLGKSDRWFVDDGENKGFARASLLRPYVQGRDDTAPTTSFASARPSIPATNTQQRQQPQQQPQPQQLPQQHPQQYPQQQPQHHPQQHPQQPIHHQQGSQSRPSTLPRRAPALPERPPRYEDIFPGPPTHQMGPPHGAQLQGVHRMYPPQYTPSQVPAASSTAEALPSKGDYYNNIAERRTSDGSHPYVSPVEESNIYEEIKQEPEPDAGRYENQIPGGCYENQETSPIYEVIDNYQVIGEGDAHTPSENPLACEENEESMFYYALYNFGGSGVNQLSLTEGQVVLVVEQQDGGWWFVEDRHGVRGYVPASYLTKYT